MRIYLDHAATSPIRPAARHAVMQGMEYWANPSSPHSEGRAARAALEEARAQIGRALGWPGEVILTSGASEAAALALARAKCGPRLVSAVEHDAILKAAPQARLLPVGADGALDLGALQQALATDGKPADGKPAGDKPLVAVQTLNSETGARQDISAIANMVHEAGGLLLADASQSAGKYPLPCNADGVPDADMVIVSAHKLGGPPGIGALLLRDFAMLEPAGGQERGYRRGTENLPAALGFAAALDAGSEAMPTAMPGDAATAPADGATVPAYCAPDVLAPLHEVLFPAMRRLGGVRLADQLAAPSPLIEALAMPHLSGSVQLMRFDMAGFAVSQGSACSSGSLKRSHVLEAMGLDADLASRVIRVSFGWSTTQDEVTRFAEAWIAMAENAIRQAA